MSFIGRSFSLVWFIAKIIIAGACGAGVTAGIIFILGIIAQGKIDIDSAGLPAGILGGAISGYFWGKYFGKLEYKKHEAMMKDLGIDVINNR